MKSKREMILGAYISYGTGHHPASWRLPEVPSDAAQNIEHYKKLALISEKGLFDFIFLSDTPSVFNDDQNGYGSRVVVFEPFTLLSALSMITNNIGLIVTSSTTYQSLYDTARKLSSLDIISNGRSGWNVVTSSKKEAAFNYGFNQHIDHDTRYEMAYEAFDIVKRLLNSWPKESLIRNKESGIFYNPKFLKGINHEGRFFKIKGPLNISKPIQGMPVIVQAGSSEVGREFASEIAELVFTATNNIEDSKIFYSDLKNRTNLKNRLNKDIRILPGICPFIANTDEEAMEKFNKLKKLVNPKFGLSMLSDLLGGYDLSECDINKPIPSEIISNGNISRKNLILKLSNNKNLSLKELYEHILVSRGHFIVIGSYKKVANIMAEWFLNNACDGFNLMPPSMPGCLEEFTSNVIPELQKLGIYKIKYKHGTLREKLGLSN